MGFGSCGASLFPARSGSQARPVLDFPPQGPPCVLSPPDSHAQYFSRRILFSPWILASRSWVPVPPTPISSLREVRLACRRVSGSTSSMGASHVRVVVHPSSDVRRSA
jgi:hypothetical protein